jgi:hypothetical protein
MVNTNPIITGKHNLTMSGNRRPAIDNNIRVKCKRICRLWGVWLKAPSPEGRRDGCPLYPTPTYGAYPSL